jgi:hypothetical protein
VGRGGGVRRPARASAHSDPPAPLPPVRGSMSLAAPATAVWPIGWPVRARPTLADYLEAIRWEGQCIAEWQGFLEETMEERASLKYNSFEYVVKDAEVEELINYIIKLERVRGCRERRVGGRDE